MKLVTFVADGASRVGTFRPKDELVALPVTSMLALIEGGPEALQKIRVAFEAGDLPVVAKYELAAPIPTPRRNIFCIGKNYREHVKEVRQSAFATVSGVKDDLPDCPIVFSKATTSVIGPGVAIPAHLDRTHSVDYEGELAVVIGRGGRDITEAAAMKHVFGYTIINDVTSREAQKSHKQWLLGKSLDGFCPMGPAIVTADEIADVQQLTLTTTVNGEVRQQGKVSEMIFAIPTLIATISSYLSFLPGDIIATGTPAGVGIGFKPAKFLRAGDRVVVRIDPIGQLENPVA